MLLFVLQLKHTILSEVAGRKVMSQEVLPDSTVQVDLDELCVADETDLAVFGSVHFEVKQISLELCMNEGR